MNRKFEWKQKAYQMYFEEHKKINEIADKVGITRQQVAKYLKSFSLFDIEKENRKKASLERHKESKREYDRTKRQRYSVVNAETIKREHEEAVRCLSREKYH